jgi:serine/threonine-protein kinase
VTDELQRLYELALELPPDARAAFVDQSCRDDDALRDELTSLLEHADAAQQFFHHLGGAVRGAVPALDRATARQFASGDGSATSAESGGMTSSTPSSSADMPATRDPMVGRTIGRYRVLALLGRGGMGTVYRARDERLARDVALKFLPVYVEDEPSAARRFLVEARAAAALVHPNVCTVHEIGETDDGRPFIAMTLYEGETLRQRLRRGSVPPREAATIAKQLASALGAAHLRGIVHRDVKPGTSCSRPTAWRNCWTSDSHRSNDASITGAGATPGTIAYMSPEQARGDVLDHRSDLWSLGVVLYEMLAGAAPFRAGSDRVMLQAIAHDSPELLAVREPRAPLALQRIVERLLQKSPDARYADAAAV